MNETIDSAFNFAEDFNRMIIDFLDQNMKYLPTIAIAAIIFLSFYVALSIVQKILSRLGRFGACSC